jgi:hypothetical protein
MGTCIVFHYQSSISAMAAQKSRTAQVDKTTQEQPHMIAATFSMQGFSA